MQRATLIHRADLDASLPETALHSTGHSEAQGSGAMHGANGALRGNGGRGERASCGKLHPSDLHERLCRRAEARQDAQLRPGLGVPHDGAALRSAVGRTRETVGAVSRHPRWGGLCSQETIRGGTREDTRRGLFPPSRLWACGLVSCGDEGRPILAEVCVRHRVLRRTDRE